MNKEIHKGFEAIDVTSRNAWRKWLEKHHEQEDPVWLILYKKESEKYHFSHGEAVEEALCFGWIDSKANKRDEDSRYQLFSQRKPKSNWSNLNKDRVKKMSEAGKMTPAGQKMIDLAKKSGTWTALEKVQKNILPEDLKKAFAGNKKARENFDAFPPSSKRIILEWILNAKRPETRAKRIRETVSLAQENIRANHYR